MVRWTTALIASLVILSSASASLDRTGRASESRLLPLKSLLPFEANEKNDEYRITAKTEVLLDGRSCRYEQIPNDATIVLLETETNESKEISRIHFRSARRTAAPISK